MTPLKSEFVVIATAVFPCVGHGGLLPTPQFGGMSGVLTDWAMVTGVRSVAGSNVGSIECLRPVTGSVNSKLSNRFGSNNRYTSESCPPGGTASVTFFADASVGLNDN